MQLRAHAKWIEWEEKCSRLGAMKQIRPFSIAIGQGQLDDLVQRIDLTRWPEEEPVDDWSQGVPLAALQALVAYWRSGYDWRRCEALLNTFPQFIAEIDGLDDEAALAGVGQHLTAELRGAQ